MEVVLPEGGVRRKSGSNHLTMLAWHLVPTKRASFAIPRSPTLGQPDPNDDDAKVKAVSMKFLGFVPVSPDGAGYRFECRAVACDFCREIDCDPSDCEEKPLSGVHGKKWEPLVLERSSTGTFEAIKQQVDYVPAAELR